MQKQEPPEDADSGEFHSRTEQENKPVRGNGKRATPNRKAKVVDPILPEKKRARRRLIGAVALVLAAVIGLPMVLDSEPKPNADDISIQIPSKDKASALVEQTGTVQVASAAAMISKSTPLVPDPVEEIIAPSNKAASDAPIKSVSPATQIEQKLDAQKSESTVDSKLQVAAATKSTAKTNSPVATLESSSKAQKKPEAADEASRALAILEGKTSIKPVAKEKATSSYIVQVAALATQEKVNELQNALKAANIKSYSQKVITVSGQVTRVRVGPFDSRDEAEKMRAKLEKMGLSGKLVPN